MADKWEFIAKVEKHFENVDAGELDSECPVIFLKNGRTLGQELLEFFERQEFEIAKVAALEDRILQINLKPKE